MAFEALKQVPVTVWALISIGLVVMMGLTVLGYFHSTMEDIKPDLPSEAQNQLEAGANYTYQGVNKISSKQPTFAGISVLVVIVILLLGVVVYFSRNFFG